MTTKTKIIDALGVEGLLLPTVLNEALAANDRVKYYFTLLQTAKSNCDDPVVNLPDLARERRASGVEDDDYDVVVSGSRREQDGSYSIPLVRRLFTSINDDMATMIAPVALAASSIATVDSAAYQQRLERAIDVSAPPADDRVSGETLDTMTHADRGRGDSLHLLVMDLHKELNRLQSEVAHENVAGASVYGITGTDRALVEGFMAGVNRTRPLKFDHPGLDATATRYGSQLVIQNDIGTTDAHVFVVHVHGLVTVVTYTDVHLQRALFFQQLLESFAVDWEDARSRRGEGFAGKDLYFLCTGSFQAADEDELQRYLRFLGSRLVFLIDWNKARKRLRNFLGKADAIALLKWAADNDLGHRGFLQLGGAQLIHDAVEYASTTPVRFGTRLDKVLGRSEASEYLKFVLRTASWGLQNGRSERLIRDEIKAELLNYFNSANQGLQDAAERHGTLVLEIANAVRAALLEACRGRNGKRNVRAAERAARWEKAADQILSETRAMIRSSAGPKFYIELLESADDAADSLEEVAFLITQLPQELPPTPAFQRVARLADMLVPLAQELIKCLAAVRHVHRGGNRNDVKDFLESVDRMVTIEHEMDDAQRHVTAALVRDLDDARQLFLSTEISRSLESAADALAHSGLMLRDYVLDEIMVA
jgi:uncharacterized protein Yka (UPF0111/DUF47 family)